MDNAGNCLLIFRLQLVVGSIETGEESFLERCLVLTTVCLVRLQQNSAEGRGERKRVDSRDYDGNGHSKTEFSIESTRCATHKRYRHEHGRHHKRDRDNGAAYLAHGINRSLARVLISHIKLGVYGLDHHNGVIHHDSDGKDKGCQREKVDREAHDPEEEHGTYQRHRHGNHWDERGAEVLKEYEHHDEHEHQGLDEGLIHLML